MFSIFGSYRAKSYWTRNYYKHSAPLEPIRSLLSPVNGGEVLRIKQLAVERNIRAQV